MTDWKTDHTFVFSSQLSKGWSRAVKGGKIRWLGKAVYDKMRLVEVLRGW